MQWLTRRQAHLQRAQQGIPISEYGVGFAPLAFGFLLKISINKGFDI